MQPFKSHQIRKRAKRDEQNNRFDEHGWLRMEALTYYEVDDGRLLLAGLTGRRVWWNGYLLSHTILPE
ncbi:hypothetical protein [Paenibacillus aceris]|uniref:Uncharacterized protein n=1 Tax=Paenibacillus aceris TaxID=869555 RepID=A0ABS4HWJ9_9BACL|nr:hypothetical protein [Paenibacillus aceris]MBP1963003.1 hypothetical protein [Paenibacillus aceris]